MLNLSPFIRLASVFKVGPERTGLRLRVEDWLSRAFPVSWPSSACFRDPSGLQQWEKGLFISGPCSHDPTTPLPRMPNKPSSPTYCSQMLFSKALVTSTVTCQPFGSAIYPAWNAFSFHPSFCLIPLQLLQDPAQTLNFSSLTNFIEMDNVHRLPTYYLPFFLKTCPLMPWVIVYISYVYISVFSIRLSTPWGQVAYLISYCCIPIASATVPDMCHEFTDQFIR